VAETYLSVSKGILPEDDGELIINYLLKTFPKPAIEKNAISSIVHLSLQDKKNMNSKIYAVLLSAIGEAVLDSEITEDDIRISLTYYNQQIK
jgi:3-dehydroquinate synthetase